MKQIKFKVLVELAQMKRDLKVSNIAFENIDEANYVADKLTAQFGKLTKDEKSFKNKKMLDENQCYLLVINPKRNKNQIKLVLSDKLTQKEFSNQWLKKTNQFLLNGAKIFKEEF